MQVKTSNSRRTIIMDVDSEYVEVLVSYHGGEYNDESHYIERSEFDDIMKQLFYMMDDEGHMK